MRQRLADLSHALRSMVRRHSDGIACAAGVAMLSLSLWSQGVTYIDEVSSSLVGIRRLVAGDSEHYLAIADDFARGDFSMQYVEPTGGPDRAHRQPAYPALLAAGEAMGLVGAPALAKIGLALVVVSLWIAFAAGASCGGALAGLVAATVVYQSTFLFDLATERLLTEPLYVAVSLACVGTAMAYLRRRGSAALLATAALAGLAYLTRTNGILLAGALAVAMVAKDVVSVRRQLQGNIDGDEEEPVASIDFDGDEPWTAQLAPEEEEEDDEDLADLPRLPLGLYAAGLAVFLLVAAPSWVPRMLYAGDPVYHGYLPNYLWVDSYERAHVPGAPRYSWKTYAEEHTIGEAIARAGYGIKRVYFDTPRDKLGVAASAAMIVALAVLLALRDRAALALATAGILQTLPLAWVALSNSARRVPAGALLPFFAVVMAAAAGATMRYARRSRTVGVETVEGAEPQIVEF